MYATFVEAMDLVGGRARMKLILQGRTADLAAADGAAHPYWDLMSGAAAKTINDRLREVGYETPLASVEDERIKQAEVYLTVGEIALVLSNAEPWMKELGAKGAEMLDQILAGGIVVIGAEESTTSQASGILGRRVDVDLFDKRFGVADDLFPDLGGENFYGYPRG